MYALNPDGTLRWEYVAEGGIVSSPVLDQDGVVYFGCYDQRLYAIKGSTGLAETPWAMFHRDSAHSSRAPAAAAPPPAIVSIQVLAGGTIQLVLETQPGHDYVPQVSGDLITWTDLPPLTAASNRLTFNDPSSSQSKRFYRVKAR